MLLVRKLLGRLKLTWVQSRRKRRYAKKPPYGPHYRLVELPSYPGQYLCTSIADRRSWLLDEGRQLHKIQQFERLCREQDATRLIDIGANYGEYSVGLSECFQDVIAVEPNPVVAEALRLSCNINNLNSKVTVVERAIGNGTETSTLLSLTFHNSGSGRAETGYPNLRSPFRDHEFSIRIKTTSIPELLRLPVPSAPNSVAVKIDIEGGELNVVEDIFRTFEYDRIQNSVTLVMFEWNKRSSGQTDRCINLLRKFDQVGFKAMILPESTKTVERLDMDTVSNGSLLSGEIILQRVGFQ